MATLFISDLHLAGERPHIITLFEAFLRQQASSAEALYILGDLFEVWLGDDAIPDDYQPIIQGLKALSDQGVPIYIMAGNRDFLLGEEFPRLSGCRLLNDPCIIQLYGEPTLLMHGDTLCTDDLDYQQVRAMVRSPQWQQAFLAKSFGERVEFAREARAQSMAATQQKPEEIMDANAQAVIDALRKTKLTRLIHGHTHRPAVHRLTVDGAAATRIVLGDWYSQESVLSVDEAGFELSHFGKFNW